MIDKLLKCKNQKRYVLLVLLSIVPFISMACWDGSSSSGGNNISDGLIIFVTEREHHADFENDPTLTGSNAIEKADYFCNEDPGKPNDSSYKALLVDGVFREAVSETDWVLEPDTTYYRSYNNVEIGTTNSNSIFTSHWEDLTNSVAERCQACSEPPSAWTGLDSSDFSTNVDTCDGWSRDTGAAGAVGYPNRVDGNAFGSRPGGYHGCGNKNRLYCVEQQE